jgi:hypothetical protein
MMCSERGGAETMAQRRLREEGTEAMLAPDEWAFYEDDEEASLSLSASVSSCGILLFTDFWAVRGESRLPLCSTGSTQKGIANMHSRPRSRCGRTILSPVQRRGKR